MAFFVEFGNDEYTSEVLDRQSISMREPVSPASSETTSEDGHRPDAPHPPVAYEESELEPAPEPEPTPEPENPVDFWALHGIKKKARVF